MSHTRTLKIWKKRCLEKRRQKRETQKLESLTKTKRSAKERKEKRVKIIIIMKETEEEKKKSMKLVFGKNFWLLFLKLVRVMMWPGPLHCFTCSSVTSSNDTFNFA